MTTEEKFHAAVNVIKNLPKNGAFQPSTDLQLKFYAYFKQATEGPCKQSKPAFWDLVRKAKIDAWKRLGDMSKDDAMIAYVDQLKNIVETMSYNDNVETFMGSLDSFYEAVPPQELNMILGPVIEKIRSQPGSPLNKSPLGSPNQKSPYESRSNSPPRISPPSEQLQTSDTESQISPIINIEQNNIDNINRSLSSSTNSINIKTKQILIDKLNDNIKNIQIDLSNISNRLKRLEMLSKLLAVQRNNNNSFWSMLNNNIHIVSAILLWPILTQLFIIWIKDRRRNTIRR